MVAELAPGSKVAEAINQLTAAVTGRAPEPRAKTKKSSSFLGNLFKK